MNPSVAGMFERPRRTRALPRDQMLVCLRRWGAGRPEGPATLSVPVVGPPSSGRSLSVQKPCRHSWHCLLCAHYSRALIKLAFLTGWLRLLGNCMSRTGLSFRLLKFKEKEKHPLSLLPFWEQATAANESFFLSGVFIGTGVLHHKCKFPFCLSVLFSLLSPRPPEKKQQRELVLQDWPLSPHFCPWFNSLPWFP